MRYSIFFAIVLVLVSGFIAYFGDLLGRRMGKKRLTLFGLRPRHTAIGVTTITGMIIAALALITLISINKPFQRMFREGDQIIERNSVLSKANADLESKNRQLVARSLELEKTVAKWQKEVDTARKNVQEAMQARNAALQARDRAVKARDASLKAIAHLQQDIGQRKIQLAELKRTNAETKSQLEARKQQLDDVQTKLVTEQGKLKSAQDALMVALGRLTVANANLDKANAKLAENTKTLEDQEQKIRDQQKSIVEMGKQQLQLVSTFRTEYSRLHDAVVRQGDELARGAISDSGSAFVIRGDLARSLDQASKRAEALGAPLGANGRAVKLIFRQPIDKDKELVIEEEQECMTMAIRAILDGNRDAMVQVVCAGNALAGEQVRVEFKFYENKLVFREGWLISGTKLDGRLSEGRILLSVIDFLRKDISEEGLRAGIIPIANPGPRDTTGGDPVNQVDALIALVDQIKAADAPVKVQAFAAKDVYSAGPLNMDNMTFKITKLE